MKISMFCLCGLSMSFAELVGYTEDWIIYIEFERLHYLFCQNIALRDIANLQKICYSIVLSTDVNYFRRH